MEPLHLKFNRYTELDRNSILQVVDYAVPHLVLDYGEHLFLACKAKLPTSIISRVG